MTRVLSAKMGQFDGKHDDDMSCSVVGAALVVSTDAVVTAVVA